MFPLIWEREVKGQGGSKEHLSKVFLETLYSPSPTGKIFDWDTMKNLFWQCVSRVEIHWNSKPPCASSKIVTSQERTIILLTSNAVWKLGLKEPEGSLSLKLPYEEPYKPVIYLAFLTVNDSAWLPNTYLKNYSVVEESTQQMVEGGSEEGSL